MNGSPEVFLVHIFSWQRTRERCIGMRFWQQPPRARSKDKLQKAMVEFRQVLHQRKM
jgi:hypothetical protein